MSKYCMICGQVGHIFGITVHSFPTESNRRKLWIKYAEEHGIDPKSVSTGAKLCMRHFNADFDFISNLKTNRLTQNAVPSLRLTKVNEAILKMKKINLVEISAINVKMWTNNNPVECIHQENSVKNTIKKELIDEETIQNIDCDYQFITHLECEELTSVLEVNIDENKPDLVNKSQLLEPRFYEQLFTRSFKKEHTDKTKPDFDMDIQLLNHGCDEQFLTATIKEEPIDEVKPNLEYDYDTGLRYISKYNI